MMTDVETVNQAASLIQKHGLAIGLRERQGSYCALGALGKARYNDPWAFEIDDSRVVTRLVKALGLPHTSEDAATALADWSNASKDKGIVVRAFRRVVKQWRTAAK